MLDRIPGIEIALSDNESDFGGADRRLGGCSQILIDGKGLAVKATILRLSARRSITEIDSFELRSGTVFSSRVRGRF